MMILDHKRDVRTFEKATKSNDADVKLFATKYLPVVQSHLEKIRTLKKKI
jgi:putative membrane protein